MYSRYHDRSDRPIRLPENYGGCAFGERGSSTERGEEARPRHLEVGKPTPPPAHYAEAASPSHAREEDCAEMPQNLPVVTEEDFAEEEATPASASPASAFLRPFGGLFGNVGQAFPFSHGMGFEEILILGLILLLSREEQGSDLVLWLALLLFCG